MQGSKGFRVLILALFLWQVGLQETAGCTLEADDRVVGDAVINEFYSQDKRCLARSVNAYAEEPATQTYILHADGRKTLDATYPWYRQQGLYVKWPRTVFPATCCPSIAR